MANQAKKPKPWGTRGCAAFRYLPLVRV